MYFAIGERCGCGLAVDHPGYFSQCRLVWVNGVQTDPRDVVKTPDDKHVEVMQSYHRDLTFGIV